MPPRRKAIATPQNAFADALNFCALILKDKGTIYETHVAIKNNWVSCFNGILAIGCRCSSDIVACPQIKLATEALSKCGQNIAITQLDSSRLSIKSDKFKAIIPCVQDTLMSAPIPDPPLADIDDRLKDALIVAGELVNENGQFVYNVSVLLSSCSVLSSMGGSVIFEYWHGINLPPFLAIPKSLCTVLSKINKKLTKFGYSQWSVTLYFEDDSWIRTQLYAEQWPDIGHIFHTTGNLQPFPVDFFKALAAVSPFSEGLVYFGTGKLRSHGQEGAGADYELPGLIAGPIYPARQLAFLQPWAKTVDFQAQGEYGPCLLAMGKNARCVIAGVKNVH